MTELPTHMTNVLMLFFKNTHFQYKPLEKKKKKRVGHTEPRLLYR